MHLPTKELFLIIPMHMMNREIIPGGESGFDGVIYKLWSLLTPWSCSFRSGWPRWRGWSK